VAWSRLAIMFRVLRNHVRRLWSRWSSAEIPATSGGFGFVFRSAVAIIVFSPEKRGTDLFGYNSIIALSLKNAGIGNLGYNLGLARMF
jgi:hypothetical protein